MDGESDDVVLMRLIEITAASIHESRPIFDNIFRDEPTFYRKHFRPWVEKAIHEAAKMKAVVDKTADPTSR